MCIKVRNNINTQGFMRKLILILAVCPILAVIPTININLTRNTGKIIIINKPKATNKNIIDKLDYYAIKHNLDPIVFQEMIRKESRFNQYAIGDNGEARGLGQIQNKWHKATCLLSDKELLDIDLNLDCSARILSKYLKEANNDYFTALSRYNGGYSNSKESKKYAKTILSKANQLRQYA